VPAYPLLKVNGVSIDDPAGRWGISPEQPLRTLPGRRAYSVSVPGRAGVTVPRRSVRDAESFPVAVRVFGMGNTMSARATDLEANLQALDFLFTNNGEVYPIQYISGPLASHIQQAYVRKIASSEPRRIGGGDAADVTFILEIPSGDWRDVNVTDVVLPYPFANPVTLTGLNGSVNSIDDPLYILEGPFTDFTIADPVSGNWLRFTGGGALPRISANQFVRIDTQAMKAGYFNGFSWTNLGSDCTSFITSGGPDAGRGWLNLVPRMNGTDPLSRSIKLTVNPTGTVTTPTATGLGTRLRIQARRSF
jgi:hypothetical protein